MSKTFVTETEAASPVIEELTPGSNTLILIFGGIKGAMGMPTFEFYKSSSILKENRVFFRDISQNWYHSGLHGITKDIDETAIYIQSIIEQIKPAETIFVGNSMGGFAAILFSTLLNTGRVVAFSPQTFIDPVNKIQHHDYRWLREIFKTYWRVRTKKKYFDLNKILDSNVRKNKIEIHVSSLDKRDMSHVTHINGNPHIVVKSYAVGGHNLVRHLRDDGTLKNILLTSTKSQ